MSTAATPSLFPETPEERIDRIDGEILALLMNKPSPFTGETLRKIERAVLSAIRYHRGRANAIPLREIRRTTQLSDRQIKEAVRTLCMTFRVPVGSSKRAEKGGYYLCITAEDIAAYKHDLLDQVRAEIARFRAISSEEAALELARELWAGTRPGNEATA